VPSGREAGVTNGQGDGVTNGAGGRALRGPLEGHDRKARGPRVLPDRHRLGHDGIVLEYSWGRVRPEVRPAVVESWRSGALRISRVQRVDGSSITVAVPVRSVAEGVEDPEPQHPWITEEGDPRPPSHASIVALAAAVGGARAIAHHVGSSPPGLGAADRL
jgi:hypothetical protein